MLIVKEWNSNDLESYELNSKSLIQCKQWETLFWGSKITADGDCSHEIKRRLLLGRKAVIILDSILKNRDKHLPTKVRRVKATMVFPVVMYECESWTIKKAEHRRIDACGLQSASSAVVHRLSCPSTHGVFMDQGLNPCPLHCQVDS